MRGPLHAAAGLLGVTVVLTAGASPHAGVPRFYPDDPVWRLHDTQDASQVTPRELDVDYDRLESMFAHRAPVLSVRAQNLNSVDEVPDSSWFVNRAGRLPLSPDDVARGPNTTDGPGRGTWTVISAKDDGVMPGLVVRDEAGIVWFIKFDPPGYRGMASGAEVISTKLLWAIGYHVPENHVAAVREEQLRVDTHATIRTQNRRRPMRQSDIAAVLRRAARDPDGTYRVMASRRIEGKPLGPFRSFGVRPDDPNDYVPHEHRRELRGYGAFAAWLNHVDSKSSNSFDALVTEGGVTFVKHYLLDFGSTLGSGGVVPREPYEGWEYLVDGRDLVKSVVSFGLRVKPWRTHARMSSGELGALHDSTRWDPDNWKPRYPNPAFLRSRADDRFWAARKLQALSVEHVAAVVRTAEYLDRHTEQAVTHFLLQRRDAILRRYLTGVNPVVDPELAANGLLTFVNAAVEADLATAPAGYETVWSWFDNATGDLRAIGSQATRSTTALAPLELSAREGAFVRIDIRAIAAAEPSWEVPVHAYFRGDGHGWTLVGFERLPESAVPAAQRVSARAASAR